MSDSKDSNEEQRQGERRKNKGFDYEGAERRREQRIKGIVIEFTRHGSADAPQGAFLRDMSSTGFSISVVEKFEVGQILDLNIYLTDVPDPVELETEVRWVRISEYFTEAKREHYDVGLKISSIEDDALKIIEKYVDQHKADV